jgi:hypothetical protein
VAPDPVTRLEHELDWTYAAEVVVVGGGIAGLATAVHAADLGASVILLEKGVEVGGTSAKAAAGMMIPNNRYLRDLGREDPKDDFIRFLARVGRPLLYDPDQPRCGLPSWEHELIETYWEDAAPSVERLEELDALRTVHAPDWPSYNEVPEDKARFGRVLFTLGDDGDVGTGVDCIARLRRTAEAMGVRVLTGRRVDGVFVNGGNEVVGVRAADVTARAGKAVVFATGGFAHNEDYRREYLGGRYTTGCSAITGEGDFIAIARALGAPLHNMDSAWGSPVVYEQVLDGDPGLISNFALPGDSILQVNRYGVRVGNEKATYNDRTQPHFVWEPTRAEYPNWLQFAVWDQRNADLFAASPGLETGNFIPPKDGRPLVSAQRQAGARLVASERADAPDPRKYVVRGETLDELGARLDERLTRLGVAPLPDAFIERLRSTVERFNSFARGGRDEDFGRGETAIELLMHGPRADDNDLPNPTMFPLAPAGPYYATMLAPGIIDTKGGPKVNARLQVLDGAERPIPGLYGVGNCVASASGQAYWSGGSTFGPYVAFAYAAARSIVAEPVGEIDGARR